MGDLHSKNYRISLLLTAFSLYNAYHMNSAQSSLAGWKQQLLIQEMSRALKSATSNLLDRFIDSTYRFSEQPFLNEGNFRPVNEIGEAVLLKDLDGEVPEDFPEGVYIRNGPNPLNPTETTADSIFGSTSYMYYEGDGMLHALYFNKSSVGEWRMLYKNKYVDTDTFKLEREKNKLAFVPSADGQPYATLVAFILNMLRFRKPVKDSANTNIFEHAGRAFAVTENHLPYEIDINNLNTLGPYNINGAGDQPFTSHPKKIHRSGELVIMGTNTEKPHYVLGIISSDGQRLLHKVDLEFEEGKLIHDIGVTSEYNIVMDYPLLFGISRTFVGKPFIQNDMNGKSRIGVMPRFGDAESIMWFDVENHCSYHLFNCFEDGNEVVVRGCRMLGSVIPSARHSVDKSKWYGRAFLPPDKNSGNFDPSVDGILFSRPYEWRLNLQSSMANEGYLTSGEIAMDFPVINDNFIGVRNKYGYAQVVDSVETSKTGLFKYKMIAKIHFDKQDKVTISLDDIKNLPSMICKTRFGPKSDNGMATSSAGSMTPRSPLATPKSNHIDMLLAGRSAINESDDLPQIAELADIARCIASTLDEESALSQLVTYIEDLQEIVNHRKHEALTV